ncbi:MAG: hypothetical protein BWX80_04117 [Candidatus Hydrogenedentes bacterium ADurb.Bin101]|nr:MAG: hypothetical protein BWX80_04117 [Candidatus Hydrogenedentes bacterium ADurb.Bin101]
MRRTGRPGHRVGFQAYLGCLVKIAHSEIGELIIGANGVFEESGVFFLALHVGYCSVGHRNMNTPVPGNIQSLRQEFLVTCAVIAEPVHRQRQSAM